MRNLPSVNSSPMDMLSSRSAGFAGCWGLAAQAGLAGQHEVVESADIQHRHIGVQRRIAVGREKPSSRLVLPNCHIYVQRLIYRRNRSRDVQDHAVRVRPRPRQAIRLEELNQLVVVSLGRAKPLGKLTRTQITPVVWAPRIGDLFQEKVEFWAIA